MRAAPSGAGIGGQALDQGLVDQADATDLAQVLVHDDPGVEIEGEGVGEEVDQVGVAAAETRRAVGGLAREPPEGETS